MSQCNQINFDTLDAQMHALTEASRAHLQELGITPDKIIQLYNAGNGITRGEDLPWSYARLFLRYPDARLITCSVLSMPDGAKMLTLTLHVRAKGGSDVVFLTFAIDDIGLRNLYTLRDHMDYYNDLFNQEVVFQRLLAKIASGREIQLSVNAWILSPSTDQPGLMDQWPDSKRLLDEYNPQTPWSEPRYPTIYELSSVPTSDLLNFFLGPDFNKLSIDYQSAIADELVKRHPVIPLLSTSVEK